MAESKKAFFGDSSVDLEKRLDDLLSQLSLEEKMACLTTSQTEFKKLGLSSFGVGGEGAHGFVDKNAVSTTFPQTIGLACTWNKSLLNKIGGIIGDEARACYNECGHWGNALWFPTIDMERDPRWGRNEEAYGEDPCLTGELASEVVKGCQGNDPFYIKATSAPKHFFANNHENWRTKDSCTITPRCMYEYYLEPFRRIYEDGKAFSLMTSYNAVNGVPMMANPLVNKFPKEKWGLKSRGYIVTDGGGVRTTIAEMQYFSDYAHAVAASLKNGADCMTDDADKVIEGIKGALKLGLIDEFTIEEHARNVLRVRMRMGQFDSDLSKNPYSSYDKKYVMTEQSKAVTRQSVRESVVLLKNNGMLPVVPEKIGKNDKVAVIGPLCDENYIDWYSGYSTYKVTPLEAFRKTYGKENIIYEDGCDIVSFSTTEGLPFILSAESELVPGKKGDTPACFTLKDWGWGAVTLRSVDNGKYLDLVDINFNNQQVGEGELKNHVEDYHLKASASFTCATYYVTTVFNLIPYKNSKSKDILEVMLRCWNGSNFTSKGVENSGNAEILHIKIEKDGKKAAQKAAKKASFSFVFCGSNPMINGKEDNDRTFLDLPLYQSKLLDCVKETSQNTALVMISGYPYTLSKNEQKTDAILYLAHGLQEEGNGLVDIVSGKYSPAGRLPQTWYKNVDQLGSIKDYDIIQNGRTYQYFEDKVLYPFGYGLSYSSFEYSDLKIKGTGKITVLSKKTPVTVSLTVKNTGKFTADEVVQLYVSVNTSEVKRPVKTLFAFDRITLEPSEKKKLEFTLTAQAVAVFDVNAEKMVIEDGEITVEVGSSSDDIRLTASLPVDGEKLKKRNPYNETQAQFFAESKRIRLGEKKDSTVPAVFFDETENSNFGQLTFERMNFSHGAETLEAVVTAGSPCHIEVLFKGKKGWRTAAVTPLPNTGDVCTVPFDKKEQLWTSVCIPLDSKIPAGVQKVRLVLYGPAGIHTFRFI